MTPNRVVVHVSRRNLSGTGSEPFVPRLHWCQTVRARVGVPRQPGDTDASLPADASGGGFRLLDQVVEQPLLRAAGHSPAPAGCVGDTPSLTAWPARRPAIRRAPSPAPPARSG